MSKCGGNLVLKLNYIHLKISLGIFLLKFKAATWLWMLRQENFLVDEINII